MKTIEIDGNRFQTEEELHQFLKEELDFPEFYGMNLDALWDCLTGFISLPLAVVWKNFGESRRKWGDRADIWLQVFQMAQEEEDGMIRFICDD